MKVVEIRVPAPWGTIAGKAWGDFKNEVVLCVHGLQDNAASFDRLIPLLPKNYYYICIDLPGHGKSTHLPPSFFIYNWDYLVVLKVVFEHIKRCPLIILGHSYGAQLGYYFAILYPKCVKKLIMLDSIHFKPVYAEDFKNYMMDRIEKCIKLQKKMINPKTPEYTYEEALNRILDHRIYGALNEDTAKVLLERNLIPIGNGNEKFTFSLDQRLKFYVDPFHDETYELEVYRKNLVKCPTLIIFTSESKVVIKFNDAVKKEMLKSSDCFIEYVEGAHNAHLLTPEKVAPFINKFLLNTKSKL